MVSVLASSVVDCEFEPRSGQTKDYEIGICCFSAKHEAWAHITSLAPPLFIEVAVNVYMYIYMCVKGIEFATFYDFSI
jgi:hypothetical protein